MRGAKLILVSTDWVFDGTQGPADEATPPNPVNYYGLLKVVCETVVAESAHNWAVARVSAVNGVHWLRPDEPLTQNAGFGYFLDEIVQTIRRGEPYTVWEGDINMVATPSLASHCAEMMLRIATSDAQGIFHCCGGEAIGRRALALLAAQEFGCDTGLIRTGPPDPHDPGSRQGIPIPYDTSLSAIESARRLDVDLLSARQIIQGYRRQKETGTL